MQHAPPDDRLRKVFAARLHAVVDHLAAAADAGTIQKVLEMADAFSGLAVAMQRIATADAPVVQDPLAAARIRGIGARQNFIRRAGGLLSVREVAERLGITPQAVSARRRRGTVLAVPLSNGEWVYPACQITRDGLVPGLAAFLRAFRDADPWTRLAVLLAPSARHGHLSALELLMDERVAEARSIAATYGEHG